MSDIPSPPAGTPGEPTPSGQTPSPDRPDAYAFFKEYYAKLSALPTGKTNKEVDAFESKHGKNSGYTHVELGEIAKSVRANLREAQRESPNVEQEPPRDTPRSSEKWIRGIGFGVFLL